MRGFGFKYLKLDTPLGKLVLGSEVMYLGTAPVSSGNELADAFGLLGSMLMGLKAEAYAGLELKF